MTDDPIGATGNFGNLADDYERGRKEYPPSVIDAVNRHVSPKVGSLVLDLGCGTGKATRLLATASRFLIGADPDEKCIHKAQESGGINLAYRLASADNLPFADGAFAAVTTFGSFHWWYQLPGALDSVYRVLRHGGTFIVVNKDDAGTFRQDIREVVGGYSQTSLTDSKTGYDPTSFLQKDGRWEVENERLAHDEVFTLEELLWQIRSMSAWNAVPEDRREEASEAMKKHFAPQVQSDGFHRPLLIRVVAARKLP